MEELHILKKSYDGYCVGTGVEYPGIIVSAKDDEELKENFLEILPVHKKALEKYKSSNRGMVMIKVNSKRLDQS